MLVRAASIATLGIASKLLGDKLANLKEKVNEAIDEAGLKGACFVAGTLILTATGLMPIETIATGDLVQSFHPQTQEVSSKQVEETFIRESSELVHVSVGDERITTTPEHPFYVAQKGFVKAVKLRAGDILCTVNGEYVIVEQVQHEILESPVKVYNFRVADNHTYFVGNVSVGVHNNDRCTISGNNNTGDGESGELKEVYNSIKDSPKYPEGFQARPNGTVRKNINNSSLLNKLREIESGTWKKVYKDGYDVYGNEISIHFFQSQSGKVFDVKVKSGWSN